MVDPRGVENPAEKSSATEVETSQGVWGTEGASLFTTMSVGLSGNVIVFEPAAVPPMDTSADRLRLIVFAAVLTR